jgi:hypothetical protein
MIASVSRQYLPQTLCDSSQMEGIVEQGQPSGIFAFGFLFYQGIDDY